MANSTAKFGEGMKQSLLVLSGGLVGGGAVWLLQGGSLRLIPASMSYEAFVGILLTAVSVIVAAIGIGVGLVAFWGFVSFRTMVDDAAKKAAITKVDEELKEGEVRKHVENIVTKFMDDRRRDGTLAQLLEERAKEDEALSDLDRGWFEVDEDNHAQ